MYPETKKLGELLEGAGLITPGQLQEALRYQKVAGGRMGSNLVAMGIISDDSLMDFLAQQTGVPRLDVRNLDVQPTVLQRIPRRLAEQMTILPVAFKEPKSLVVAMADPSDLNGVDSARFASGLTIEPVVASHTALKLAIADQYRKLESSPLGVTIDMNRTPLEDGIPLAFEMPITLQDGHDPMAKTPTKGHLKDPFFDNPPTSPALSNPFSFFSEPSEEPKPTDSQDRIIHVRSAMSEQVRPLDQFGDRVLVMGLVRLLQRRGILGADELQRFIINQIEAGDLSDNG